MRNNQIPEGPVARLDRICDTALEVYAPDMPIALILPRELFDESVAGMKRMGIDTSDGERPLLNVKYRDISLLPVDYLPIPKSWAGGMFREGIWAVPHMALAQVLTGWQKMGAWSKKVMSWPEEEKP